MGCGACGTDNPADNRFCGRCGTPLSARCPACEAEVAADDRFCGKCGTALSSEAMHAPPTAATTHASAPSNASAPTPAPVAERRHVSVLFVDLVGFTTLSEDRDPEAVRELLSAYFEQARTVVGRYGGVIEKFIGDAVMAVWGTPVAREDDAERAVRAGLDLVDAVAVLGEESGLPGLRARAGIVTGEAAVQLDAVDQSMVAGDVVNTAARVQAIATPGTVLVDDATREVTSRAIGYAAGGEHEVKGRAEPVRVFTAMQVVAGSGGAQRVDGLEPPFLGRERDLRMLKELLHDGVEQSRAQLVVVRGPAGVGKSRLGWEFFKYVDGIEQLHYWHVGRCLAYGEGVAYWALAEMVRMRFRISESDPEAEAVHKLDAGLAEHVADGDERAWLRPRLAVLLGLADVVDGAGGFDRDSLFAGWRLFLERLAQRAPVVMVFEDAQDADPGLLDFLDHLLQWAADLPLFMLVLARPELHEQRPAWGHQRNVTLLHLDRLPDERIEAMVDAMVHGLPASARRALAARAEGVPMFAIETVRMLIDRDLVVPRGGVYVLADGAGDLGELDVPPTLHALVAARLDGLPDRQRRLVRDAAVLGQSFTPSALTAVVAAVGDIAPDEVGSLLDALATREVLTVRADARSPEAGQYRFVQKVMQAVAYETLSRRDRKVRHLAAAEHLLATGDAEDIAGVVATHYLGAADALPEADDADALRATAVRHLEQAGARANALAAVDEALRYHERALTLATAADDRARIGEAGGIAALRAGQFTRSLELLAPARELAAARGDLGAVARIASFEGESLINLGRFDEAATLMRDAYAGDDDAPNVDQARLAAALAMFAANAGDVDGLEQWADRAAAAAEATGDWEVLGRALSLLGVRRVGRGRPVEGEALTRGAYELARRHGLHFRAAMQASHLAEYALGRDLAEAQHYADEALVESRRSGDRTTAFLALNTQSVVQFERGDWDAIDVDALRGWWDESVAAGNLAFVPTVLVQVAVWQGRPDLLDGVDPFAGHDRSDPVARSEAAVRGALVTWARGDLERALSLATEAIRRMEEIGVVQWEVAIPRSIALDAALGLARLDAARAALALASTVGPPPPFRAAHDRWGAARMAAAAGDDAEAQAAFTAAARAFRDLSCLFWLGRVLLDHAEWLVGRGEHAAAGPLAAEAQGLFEQMDAAPFVVRAGTVVGSDDRLAAAGPQA